MSKQIRVAGIVEDSIVDGPGLRLTIFAQGCEHHCPGCHNPQTHDPKGGDLRDLADIKSLIANNPLCSGVTLSGGEPLLQAEACAELAEFSQGLDKNVWLYSGYTWENLLEMGKKNPSIEKLLQNTDVLVDGPYLEKERSLRLLFRGSFNQRIIDVKSSLSNPGKPCVLVEEYQ